MNPPDQTNSPRLAYVLLAAALCLLVLLVIGATATLVTFHTATKPADVMANQRVRFDRLEGEIKDLREDVRELKKQLAELTDK